MPEACPGEGSEPGGPRRLGEHLGRGDIVHGPAIIEEYTATTVVHAADVCTVGDHGELTITIGAQEHRTRRGRR